jgi:hypothetical protein
MKTITHSIRTYVRTQAIAQRVLTADDWERLEEEHFTGDVTPRHAARIVPWAAYGVPHDLLDRVFAEVGRGFWVLWLLTRRRFARRASRAAGLRRVERAQGHLPSIAT